ncbi:hypothetical protein F4561_002782 [Lipingzhangella halophila]|uniref:Uncharacterized protein n=1 Tax=Lipingzhangella halophila TaxID=1783352 RepID=A0A7W7W2G5_9ACTN|nr:hypothetical protein [Lipingzhangella halophila]MBB4931962.1 hypothetical protein [Lipingzhangella halophila]
MRHVVGFLAGLILAPVVLLGGGWAFTRMSGLGGGEAAFLTTAGLIGLAGLFGLALLMALVMVPPRLTPLLPGITGLSLAGFTAVNVLRPELLERLPGVPGLGGALELAGLGLYLPLAFALVIPLFVASRWVRAEPYEESAVTPAEYFDGLYGDEEEPPEESRRGGRRRRTA